MNNKQLIKYNSGKYLDVFTKITPNKNFTFEIILYFEQ